MQAAGWGNYPRIDAQWLEPASESALLEQLATLGRRDSVHRAVNRQSRTEIQLRAF